MSSFLARRDPLHPASTTTAISAAPRHRSSGFEDNDEDLYQEEEDDNNPPYPVTMHTMEIDQYARQILELTGPESSLSGFVEDSSVQSSIALANNRDHYDHCVAAAAQRREQVDAVVHEGKMHRRLDPDDGLSIRHDDVTVSSLDRMDGLLESYAVGGPLPDKVITVAAIKNEYRRMHNLLEKLQKSQDEWIAATQRDGEQNDFFHPSESHSAEHPAEHPAEVDSVLSSSSRPLSPPVLASCHGAGIIRPTSCYGAEIVSPFHKKLQAQLSYPFMVGAGDSEGRFYCPFTSTRSARGSGPGGIEVVLAEMHRSHGDALTIENTESVCIESEHTLLAKGSGRTAGATDDVVIQKAVNVSCAEGDNSEERAPPAVCDFSIALVDQAVLIRADPSPLAPPRLIPASVLSSMLSKPTAQWENLVKSVQSPVVCARCQRDVFLIPERQVQGKQGEQQGEQQGPVTRRKYPGRLLKDELSMKDGSSTSHQEFGPSGECESGEVEDASGSPPAQDGAGNRSQEHDCVDGLSSNADAAGDSPEATRSVASVVVAMDSAGGSGVEDVNNKNDGPDALSAGTCPSSPMVLESTSKRLEGNINISRDVSLAKACDVEVMSADTDGSKSMRAACDRLLELSALGRPCGTGKTTLDPPEVEGIQPARQPSHHVDWTFVNFPYGDKNDCRSASAVDPPGLTEIPDRKDLRLESPVSSSDEGGEDNSSSVSGGNAKSEQPVDGASSSCDSRLQFVIVDRAAMRNLFQVEPMQGRCPRRKFGSTLSPLPLYALQDYDPRRKAARSPLDEHSKSTDSKTHHTQHSAHDQQSSFQGWFEPGSVRGDISSRISSRGGDISSRISSRGGSPLTTEEYEEYHPGGMPGAHQMDVLAERARARGEDGDYNDDLTFTSSTQHDSSMHLLEAELVSEAEAEMHDLQNEVMELRQQRMQLLASLRTLEQVQIVPAELPPQRYRWWSLLRRSPDRRHHHQRSTTSRNTGDDSWRTNVIFGVSNASHSAKSSHGTEG